MANVSRVNGFKPIKHFSGAPYNGQATLYEVPAAETIPIFVGDLVIRSGNATVSGLVTVKSLSAATTANEVTSGVILGAVVGVVNAKMDINGKMTAGGITLDTPQYTPASTLSYVLVADSPDLIFEVESTAVYALANIGKNADVAVLANTTSLTNGASPMYVSATTPTASATRPLHVVGFARKVDNEIAAASNKVHVQITTHAHGNAIVGV